MITRKVKIKSLEDIRKLQDESGRVHGITICDTMQLFAGFTLPVEDDAGVALRLGRYWYPMEVLDETAT